ncbi:MAG: ABC transporter permease [Planctomycetes bacterium]|nr:ABC transporter permease [Planctomycetota bacterium]
MQRLFARIGFPLLAKELTEQAAQRRTYVIRVLYALALFVGAWILFQDILGTGRQGAFGVLGQGREMFVAIVTLEFIGIYLFVPAMSAGVIAIEKERNSLSTLLLTRLSPMTIVLEKFLGRLVPTFTFLLLSLPLIAFTYTLGGVTQGEFWAAAILLVLSGMQVAALAVMCSSFARTAAGAFIGTYLLGVFVHFLLPPCSGWYQFQRISRDASAFSGFTIVSLFTTCGFLAAARVFLVERAFLEPRNVLLEIFKGVDRFFTDLNKVTGGIELVKDRETLPEDKPITWRETRKKSLGTVRYLFRVLAAVETPLLFILVAAAGGVTNMRVSVAGNLLYVLWVLAIALVAVKATSVIASEKSSQTWDLLRVLPLSGREILMQKLSGVRRLIGVLSIPFLTIFAFEWYWAASLSTYGEHTNFVYLAASAASVYLYLGVATWGSFWIGVKLRSQTRAIVASLAVVSLVAALPALAGMPGPHHVDPQSADTAFLLWGIFSPSYFVSLLVTRQFHGWIVAGNLAFYALVWLGLRTFCLRRADRLLDRAEALGATG